MAKKGRDQKGRAPQPMSTKQRLVQALFQALGSGDRLVAEMIERATAGYYDDYDSPLATPLVQLAADLREYGAYLLKNGRSDEGVNELIAAVKDGAFDATKAEADAWMVREGGDILARGFLPETAQRAGKKEAGAADMSRATYLTQRLTQFFDYLAADPNVQYSRGDLLMGLHNAHTWSLLSMLDQEKSMPLDVRNGVLRSAATTFEMRMKSEMKKTQKRK